MTKLQRALAFEYMLYSYKTIEGIENLSSGRIYCQSRVFIVTVKADSKPTEFIERLARQGFGLTDCEVNVSDNLDDLDEQATSYFKGRMLKNSVHDIRKISNTTFNAPEFSFLNENPEELSSFSFTMKDKKTYFKLIDKPVNDEGISVELFENTNRYFVVML